MECVYERTSVVLEPGFLDRILYGLWVAVWCELLREMFPDVADVVTSAVFNIVDHVLDCVLRDFGLAPRRLSDALIIPKRTVPCAPRYLEPIEDLIVREAVAEAVLHKADYFMMLCNPCAAFFLLLSGCELGFFCGWSAWVPIYYGPLMPMQQATA